MVHDRPDDEDDRKGEDRTPEDRPPDEEADRDDEDRRRDESNRETGGFGLGVGGHIGRLLEFLDEAGTDSDQPRRRPSGRDHRGIGRTPKGKPSSSDRFSLDLDVSIGSLGGDDRSDDRGGRSRKRRRRSRVTDDAGEHLTTVRHDGEDVVVTADLPDVEMSDLTVGVTEDGRTLVVGADGEELARLPVENWDESAVSATFNNFILEVRVDDDVVAGDPDEVVSR